MLTKAQQIHRDLCWEVYEYTDRDGQLQRGYVPHAEQQTIHDSPSRFKLIAGGVGAGKSLVLAREAEAYTSILNGLGWIVGPTYELALPEFDYILAVARLLEIVDESTVSRPSRGTARFKTIWGFEWVTKSSENLEELAGRRPHVIVLTEAAQNPPGILTKLFERSAENRAPILMGGTFESGYGWYAEQWERWRGDNPEKGQSFSLPTWTNLVRYPGGREDPEILLNEELMKGIPGLFMERYGGIPSKPSGLVFREFDRAVHCSPVDELFDPDLPVELAIDPGVHCYSILFLQRQRDGKTVHVLDEVYAKGMIGQQVIPQVVASRFWAHSCHTGIIDIFGQRQQGANTSQVEVWASRLDGMGQHKISLSSVPIFDVDIWYQQLHLRLWHDEERPPLLKFAGHLNDTIGDDGIANGILGELKTHRWPARGELQASARRPIKKNEDALSALGYYLVYYFGPVEERKQPIIQTVRKYF